MGGSCFCWIVLASCTAVAGEEAFSNTMHSGRGCLGSLQSLDWVAKYDAAVRCYNSLYRGSGFVSNSCGSLSSVVLRGAHEKKMRRAEKVSSRQPCFGWRASDME
eukprot:5501105-Amphidinium_carterae.1